MMKNSSGGKLRSSSSYLWLVDDLQCENVAKKFSAECNFRPHCIREKFKFSSSSMSHSLEEEGGEGERGYITSE